MPVESETKISQDITRECSLPLLKTMMQIRHFEERALQLFTSGDLIGMCHVSVGQEAVATGVCSELRVDDYVASTHRGHGHCIAKGANIGRMFAELLGRETGYCKGRGGSMHIADVEIGFLGANGIVGAGLPIATGAGLSIKYRETDQVAVCFFGDGATNIGSFHESLNMAAAFQLPVLYVCENNMYALSSNTADMSGAKCVADKAAAYCMESKHVDGMDVYAVKNAARELIKRARSGGGPALLECDTYRYYGHSKSDTRPYRTRDEENVWRSRDCINSLSRRMTEAGLASDDELKALECEAVEYIENQIQWARECPFTKPEEVGKYVFTEGVS